MFMVMVPVCGGRRSGKLGLRLENRRSQNSLDGAERPLAGFINFFGGWRDPGHHRRRSFGNDRLATRQFLFAAFRVLAHDGFEIVNVVQKHVVQLLHRRVNVPRHGNVHEEQRAVAARRKNGGDVVAMQNGVRRAGGADHDVRIGQRLPAFVKMNGASAEFGGELLRAFEGAVGHQHRPARRAWPDGGRRPRPFCPRR